MRGEKHMKQHLLCTLGLGVVAALTVSSGVGRAENGNDNVSGEIPLVFQAAGPNAASIQSTVDQYRAAFGGANNGNGGPQAGGRREINWDGGGSSASSVGATPFEVFLINRGARITTPGSGFVQSAPSGLAALFENPSYANIFKAFSPPRLFSPIDSNRSTIRFFLPGGGDIPAAVSGFGAVFSDVDRQDRDDNHHGDSHKAASTVEYFDAEGRHLYTGVVPASPGDGTLSFFGIVFDDARIARVRITTGNAVSGADDTRRHDVVMMDDFIYGEPKIIQ